MNDIQNLGVRNYYARFKCLPFKTKLGTLDTLFQCNKLGITSKTILETSNLLCGPWQPPLGQTPSGRWDHVRGHTI